MADINVYAAAPGRVKVVGYDEDNTPTTGYGYRIIIDHGGGYETVYGHLEENSANVYVGEKVSVGKVIGRMGGTGNCRPPGAKHLHFELRRNGVPIDPQPHYIAQGGPIVTPPPIQPPDVTPPTTSSGVIDFVSRWQLLPEWDYLNLRSYPSTQAPIVGRLDSGAIITGNAIAPGDGGLWVRIPQIGAEKWAAALHDNNHYLEIKE